MVDVSKDTKRVRKAIVDGFVRNGRAPNLGELGRALDLSRSAVLECFRQLSQVDTFSLESGTENNRVLSPFSNLPTPYCVSVNGAQRWFAACGLEALGITFMFPGKRVEIDAYCRDCGDSIRLAMKDGEMLEQEPPDLVAHVGVPVARWFEDLAFA